MSLLRRLFAEAEFTEQPYSAEVLCANWVARPLEQPAAPGHGSTLEPPREADSASFLARIYASQRC